MNSSWSDISPFVVVIQLKIQVWGQTGGKLYGPVAGEDYEDNQTRFILLSLVSTILLEL